MAILLEWLMYYIIIYTVMLECFGVVKRLS